MLRTVSTEDKNSPARALTRAAIIIGHEHLGLRVPRRPPLRALRARERRLGKVVLGTHERAEPVVCSRNLASVGDVRRSSFAFVVPPSELSAGRCLTVRRAVMARTEAATSHHLGRDLPEAVTLCAWTTFVFSWSVDPDARCLRLDAGWW